MERPDYPSPVFQDLYWVPVYGLVIHFWKELATKLSKNFFRKKLEGKYHGETLDMKISKCCRGAFKVTYFTFTSLFGFFFVMNEVTYSPPLMGGDGDEYLILSDFPFTKMPRFLKFYYMFSFSYYAEDLITHVFKAPNSDYFEMILHHLVTIELMLGSYLGSYWMYGILVLIQMDIADIFIGLIRVVMDFCKWYYTLGIYM